MIFRLFLATLSLFIPRVSGSGQGKVSKNNARSLLYRTFFNHFLGHCGTSGTTLAIASLNDLDSISNCSTISGSLYINAQGDIDTLTLPPSLHTVTGGLFCSGASLTYLTDTIVALGLGTIASDKSDNSLKDVGLVISDYLHLTTLNFPNLTTIGSNFVLARNPLLQTINGFEDIQRINGNIDMTGNFDNVSLPNLKSVEGNFNVESSSPTFVCPDINKTAIHGTIFICTGDVANPQPLSVDNSTTNATVPLPSVSSGATTTASESASASASTTQGGSSRSSAATSTSLRIIPNGLF